MIDIVLAKGKRSHLLAALALADSMLTWAELSVAQREYVTRDANAIEVVLARRNSLPCYIQIVEGEDAGAIMPLIAFLNANNFDPEVNAQIRRTIERGGSYGGGGGASPTWKIIKFERAK